MSQRVSRRAHSILPPLAGVLALLLLPAGALAQETEGVEPPSDAIVLSLRDVLNAALEHNLEIAVRRYDPLRSDTLVTLQEAVFDPALTGSAESREDEIPGTFTTTIQTMAGPLVSSGVFLVQPKAHQYTAGFEDPLILGGSYRFDLFLQDEVQDTDFLGTRSRTSDFTTNWALTFRQPLLRNFGPDVNRWQIIVARNDLASSEEGFRRTVINTLSAAEKAYWDLNFALMELDTQRDSLDLAKEFLEQNKIKVRVGTLAPIEITQAEADVADREERVIVAENRVLGAEDDLRKVMNVPRDSPWWSRAIRPSDEPPLDDVDLSMEEEVSAAERLRPELKQARIDLRSKETELQARRNLRRWSLDFEGAYGARGLSADFFDVDPMTGIQTGSILSHGSHSESLEDLRDRNQTNWRLTLNLRVPIGNRQAIANYTDAEHAYNQSRFDLQRLEQEARVEVRNAVRTVLTNMKRVHATQVNVRLQTEKLEAEQKKFENGMSTSFQVLTFQNDLTAARSRENLAIVDYNKSLVELERVKGTLLEARRMLIPAGASGAAEGGDYTAALRSLWRRDAPARAASVAASGLHETIALPSTFVFRGNRIVGLGGTPDLANVSADGR